MLKKKAIIWFLFITSTAYAQIGGETVYNFLNFQSNARINALAGYAISLNDADLNLAIQNPALLKSNMHNQATFNHLKFVSDIALGYVGYAYSLDSLNTLAGGIQYINYGTFNRTNVNGDQIGTFTAGEYNFQASYARKLTDLVSVGASLKVISSNLDSYHSMGMAIDAGISYFNPKTLWAFSGVISNAGLQLTTYTNNNREKLPLNVMAGFSKKFLHNPLRISVVAHHLNKPGQLLYNNAARPGQNRDLETGEVIYDDITLLDQIAAHLNVSAEILLGKFMYVGFGYNHLRRYEMKQANTSKSAGFAWGTGLRFKRFQLAYGSAAYHAAYATNSFSFVLFINEFSKKDSKQ